MVHLLIAGATGSGKSVCVNTIVTRLVYRHTPDTLKFLMVDPKMVELSSDGRLPHLMHPGVTDMRKAEAILAWAVEKMATFAIEKALSEEGTPAAPDWKSLLLK
mgnify:CR=1 FL=1